MGFGKQGTGQIIREKVSNAALGALAGEDVVKVASDITLAEDFRILKSEITAMVIGLTAGEGDGLVFGMANGELTAAEVEESLEADGPLNRNDAVATARALRKVKTLGFSVAAPNANTVMLIQNENGGRLITSKDRWTYSDPEGWDYWVYNLGSTLTTGATMQLLATHYGVWVT